MHRKRWAPGHSLLLGLGLFVILGHVCALPAHAAGLDVVPRHTDATHHEPSADESVHGGSCEAVRSTFAAQPPVAPVARAVSVTVVPRLTRPSPERVLQAAATSPPLFLLHASLLI
jgi:hypothetical protein